MEGTGREIGLAHAFKSMVASPITDCEQPGCKKRRELGRGELVGRKTRSVGTRSSLETCNTRNGRECVACIPRTGRENSANVSHHARSFAGVVSSPQHPIPSALKMDGKPSYGAEHCCPGRSRSGPSPSTLERSKGGLGVTTTSYTPNRSSLKNRNRHRRKP